MQRLLNNSASHRADTVATDFFRAKIVDVALKAGKLVILSLTDYGVMYKILEGAEQALKGRVLVNLSSDTPEKAREAEKWAYRHGATFLSGGVMVDPLLVGKPEAFIFYSGDENNMQMMAAGAYHVAHTARDAGVRTDLTDLISDLYRQTVDAGHGESGLTSVIEVFKKNQAAAR